MIAIIDYGVGNLYSLKSSLKYIGAAAAVTSDFDEIRRADKILLPGVGAFGDAVRILRETGLFDVLIEQARSGKPLLGICLGMQLLFTRSYEFGEHEGLALLEGSVQPIAPRVTRDLKIPHIGWNALRFPSGGKHPLFAHVDEGEFVYFVHSYYVTDCENSLTAVTDYGIELTAAAGHKNVCGVQFHPEKSGKTGLNILRAFANF